MIAYFLMHRGPSPNFLSKTCYTAIVKGLPAAAAEVKTDDIGDETLKNNIKNLSQATDESRYEEAVDALMDAIQVAGLVPLSMKIDNKEDLANALTRFVVLDKAAIVYDR
ncbi:G2/M phase-specific E3 ubiquitin-protein ligase-like [Anneissia japonica]|uniref:G2/M phase-specific E3 ubiquitin-protein ligase-like n=1 Tax=Anneissia japonica TaxID=1529436 RepID=UPI001425B237|nr:G2/M phase-specific E3 ubiquitin-protein ligase-like [Anneissia japonica]